MCPIFFKFGPIAIYSYGLMMAIAVLVCSFFIQKEAKKELGLEKEQVVDLVFWTIIAGIVGARLYFVIANWNYFLLNPVEIIMLMKGGLSWQGGLILAAIVGVGFVRWKKWPLLKVVDLVIPYVALGQALGRIGCFFNGCCYGKEVSWGIYFPVHHARLHPTQLYATFALFIIFVILRYLRPRNTVPGRMFVLYLVLASLQRFVIEFFRDDHELLWGGLSLYQFFCLGFFIIAGLVYASITRSRR